MTDGYPDESELQRIKIWDAVKDPFGLIDFIDDITWHSDWSIVCKGKRTLYWEFHTGGWSGNEDIIEALQQNPMFWTLYWEKSLRGGHYYFKIKKLK